MCSQQDLGLRSAKKVNNKERLKLVDVVVMPNFSQKARWKRSFRSCRGLRDEKKSRDEELE